MCFLPGEGPSRDPLRDCEIFANRSFKKAVLSFGKKFAKLNSANDNIKVRAFYDFGDSTVDVRTLMKLK